MPGLARKKSAEVGRIGEAELARSLNAAVQDALASPEMQEVLTRNGLMALRESPEVFAARVKAEIERWGPLVKATGFKPED